MQFKTDENLHPEVSEWLRYHGHDAVTVWDQSLRGKSDQEIAQRCRSEKRALITVDLGFSDIRAYPPEDYPGIIILRLAHHGRKHVLASFPIVLEFLQVEPLEGKLWVVDERSVRIRGAGPGEPNP